MKGEAIEVWRGSANAWECDHLGHLNTRFYLARVEVALGWLLAELGVRAPVTVRSQHLRFHKEVRAGTALHATGQVLNWTAGQAELLIQILHTADNALAATFRLVVAGDWPATLDGGRLLVPAPSLALERGLSMAAIDGLDRTRAALLAGGAQRTGLTLLLADQCDQGGVWRLSSLMGFLADATSHLRHGDWREILSRTAAAGQPPRIGGALVEFGLVHRAWPRQGDRVELWSGLADCTDRVTYTAHWLVDATSGEVLGAVRAVGVALDLDARRLITLTPQAQEAFRAACVAL